MEDIGGVVFSILAILAREHGIFFFHAVQSGNNVIFVLVQNKLANLWSENFFFVIKKNRKNVMLSNMSK